MYQKIQMVISPPLSFFESSVSVKKKPDLEKISQKRKRKTIFLLNTNF